MRKFLVLGVFSSLVALAACGGGGGSSGGGGGGLYGGNPPATSAPQSGNQPTQSTIKGAAAFVNSSGFTLYTFAADGNGVSNCNGSCAGFWPPASVSLGATPSGGFSMITRSDGSKQWAFNGHPLYTFTGDSAAGQSSGDGLVEFGGLWKVGRPSASVASTPTPAPSTPPTPTPVPTMSSNPLPPGY